MSLLRRASGAYVWSQIGRLVEACLVFAFSVLLARVLGPDGYGTYSTGLSAAGLCVFATLLGIGPETLGKFVPELSAEGGARRVRALLMKLLALRGCAVIGLTVVVYMFSRFVSRQWSLRFFGGAVAFVLLLFAASSLYNLAVGFFGALLEVRRVAVVRLLAGVAAPVVFVLSIALTGATVRWALLATAFGYLTGGVALLWPWVRRRAEVAADQRAEPVPMRRVLEFGLFAWSVNFFIFVLSDNMDVLLVRWLSADASSAGYYAVGARLTFRLVALVMGWAPLIAIASLSHANLANGREGMASMVEGQWKLSVVSLVGPLAFLCSFASPIIRLFFSASYLASLAVVRILSVLMMLSVVCGFTLHAGILYVLGRERLATAVFGGAAAFNVASEIWLVRMMGITGAAWATGLSYLLVALAISFAASFFVPLRIPWKLSLKVLGASVTAAGSALWLAPSSPGRFAGAALLWVAVFFIALGVLKPLDAADSRRLYQLHPRLGVLAGRVFARGAIAAGQGGAG